MERVGAVGAQYHSLFTHRQHCALHELYRHVTSSVFIIFDPTHVNMGREKIEKEKRREGGEGRVKRVYVTPLLQPTTT